MCGPSFLQVLCGQFAGRDLNSSFCLFFPDIDIDIDIDIDTYINICIDKYIKILH